MPNKLCALNYHMHLITCGCDHAEQYTKNSRFTEDKSKRHINNKGSCGWK